MFNLKRKVLFGVSASMVLAMAIGSFALNETQTPASPRAVEAQSAVGATAGPFTVEGGTQGTNFDYTSPVLTIHSGNLTISTSGETDERIVVDGAATITLAGVNISTGSGPALQIQDNATFNVNILLADGSTNILKTTADDYAGLQKNGSGDSIGTLTIGVPSGSAGTGALEATGGSRGAGIGGGDSASGSNITINGGVVTANGGGSGAGIGGGYNKSGSNITITGGVVTATGGSTAAGIGGGYNNSGSNITISGGVVTATGGNHGAGIGGGEYYRSYSGDGINITISGGVVTATGGSTAAGIGGGYTGSGRNITISGGVVTAYGGTNAAGIGGGDNYRSGSNITITGGAVTAYGGTDGAGIGGGRNGSGSVNNSLNGDAVVLATSGNASKAALEGFVDDQQQSLLTQGIAFTGLGTAFDDKGHATDVTWDANGTMYGNVTLSQDLEIPANLTIPAGQILSIKENCEVTLSEEDGVNYTVEGELQNNGTVNLQADLAFSGNGKVTTKTDFYLEDSSLYNTDHQTYQTNAGVQKYTNLPNPDNSNDAVFGGWFTKPGGHYGGGTKVDENTNVLLNDHNFYEYRLEEHEITITQPEHGTVTTDPENPKTGDEVIITVIPEEGYEIDGLPIVKTEDGRIIEVIPTGNPNEYKFIMPDSDVTIEVNFVLISEPTVDPGHGGDGSDASSKTGDSFAGIAALAILGVATTGTVLLRKRK